MNTSLFLAKLIGLYLLIITLLWVLSGRVLRKRVEECMSDSGFLVLSGFLALIAGLAIVIGHNVWVADWRVVITVVGYISLLKGIVLLGWPGQLLRTSRWFFDARGKILYLVVVAPLGAWLAWNGFCAG